MNKKDLLFNVFGAKPAQPTQPQQPIVNQPMPKPVISRDNVSPEISAKVQALVWGNGNVPPPKPPTNQMADAGVAPAMSNQEGWGKI